MEKHVVTKWWSVCMLLLTAIIWGSAFVAQRVASEHVGAFSVNASRFLIGTVALLPVIGFAYLRGRRSGKPVQFGGKSLVTGGILCGIALFLASNLQQLGIERTTAGKAGFITALYIVIVPLLGLLVKKRAGMPTWVGVLLALVGMYLLCMKEDFTVSEGDLYMLACAVCFAVQIMIVDHYSPRVYGVALSCIQFFTAGVLGVIVTPIFEQPTWADLLAAWQPIVFLGVFSCGIAYTLQILAQRHVSAPLASLLMSLESVFALVSGVILLGETMTGREGIGCALMLAAVLVVQLWQPKGASRSA